MTMMFSTLLTWHPTVKIDGSPQEIETSIDAAIRECQEVALEPCQTILRRVTEIQVTDCRVPHPEGDPTYGEPRRFLQMATEYWSIGRQIVLQQMDAYGGYQPHPLLRLIVNMRLRLDVCFEKLAGFEGASEAKKKIDSLLDIVTSGEPDDLQAVPEWTTGEIGHVDAFLEALRLKLGSRSYPLTHEETAFIKVTQSAIAEHGTALKQLKARLIRHAEAWAEKRRAEQGQSDSPPVATTAAIPPGQSPSSGGKLETIAPDGEWVGPMTKADMARLVSRQKNVRWRKVRSLFPDGFIQEVTEKTFRFRIDHLDKPTQGRCRSSPT
jgi:hypothetical protein